MTRQATAAVPNNKILVYEVLEHYTAERPVRIAGFCTDIVILIQKLQINYDFANCSKLTQYYFLKHSSPKC